MHNSDRENNSGTDRYVGRRRFLRAVGVTGIATGIAGCGGNEGDGSAGETGDGSDETASGDGGSGSTPTDSGGDTDGDGESGSTPTDSGGATDTDGQTFDDVTLEYVSWPQLANNADTVNQWLHDAGMPQGITVEFSNVFNVSGGARATYQQWLSANRETPDLMEFDTGWTQPFIVRNQILDLEENLPDDVVSKIKDDYFPEMVRSVTDGNGNLWAVPHFPDYPHIQYRKDLARQAGYDPEGNNWATTAMSWQRFAEVTADVVSQTDASTGYLWQAASGLQLASLVFNEYLSSWGGAYFGNPEENLFGPIGDRPVTVDEQPVIDSLKMGRSFIEGTTSNTLEDYATISPSSVYQGGPFPQFQEYQNGDTVMMRNFPFTLPTLGAEDQFGTDLGTMPLPHGVPEGEGNYPGTGGSVHTLGGWNVAVNPNSTNVAAAMEVLKALTDETVMLNTWELFGWIPPMRSVFDTSDARDVDILGRYVDTLLYAADNSLPRPATAIWTIQEQRVAQQAHDALRDRPPAEAMSRLKSQLQTIENNY
jgi:ABC-type glycerol-3-phosphate transport system substrate-binding protein